MLIKYTTKNYKETQKIGENFAKEILNLPELNKAVVIGLSGNLGGGKTTFLQGFAVGLGVRERVLSPTFVILKRFAIPMQKIKNQKSKVKDTNQKSKINKFKNFYHFDLYRVKNYRDILESDFEEIIKNPENIVAMEWPERINKILPKNAVKIKFKFINENKREITVKSNIKN